MAIPPLIAGTSASLADALPVAPSLVLLLLLTAAVASLIYAYQPPLPQTAAFAFLPWIVSASILNVLATSGGYPPYLVPLFSEPGAYLTATFVPGLVWVAMLNASVSRRELPAYHHYIATMGVGAMAVLWFALVLQVGATDVTRLLMLVIVPVVCLLATGLIALSIGFWSPDFVEHTPFAGGFVIFAALVYGVATVASVAMAGATAHTPVSATVRDLVAVGLADGVAGVDVTHLWVWLFLVINVAVGIHVATRLAPYAAESPRAVNAMLGTVGVVGFGLGFNHLLLVVVG